MTLFITDVTGATKKLTGIEICNIEKQLAISETSQGIQIRSLQDASFIMTQKGRHNGN